MAEKTGVQSVERIFQLIEQLAAHPTGVSLQKLAGETGLAKSTVHRLLASLVGLGYVAQNDENGHYRLTLKMFELSSGIVDSMDIMGVAKAHLERLSQRTGEAVHLVIRDERSHADVQPRGPAQPAVLHWRGQGYFSHAARG